MYNFACMDLLHFLIPHCTDVFVYWESNALFMIQKIITQKEVKDLEL